MKEMGKTMYKEKWKVSRKVLLSAVSATVLLFSASLKSQAAESRLENVGSLNDYLEAIQNDKVLYTDGYDIVFDNPDSDYRMITEVLEDGKTVMTASYSEEGLHTVKDGFSHSEFEYTTPAVGFSSSPILVREIRDGVEIRYEFVYSPDDKSNIYTNFQIGDEEYSFIWDINEWSLFVHIAGIADESGQEIARYTYGDQEGKNKHTATVWTYSEGEWIPCDDPDFIGNYNKIRNLGDYYDDETGWIYGNSVYCSDGVIGLYKHTDPEWWKKLEEGVLIKQRNLGDSINSTMTSYYEYIDMQAELMAYEYLDDSDFTKEKDSNYYHTASTVEIITRLLYGECTSNTIDQQAVSWVILNRYHSGGFGSTIRDIVADPIQFNGVISSDGLSQIDNTKAAWRVATYYACLMVLDNTESCWNSIAPKPTGISNQLYFRSAKYLNDSSKSVYEINGVLYVKYAIPVAISNAAIAGKGTSTTVDGLKALCEKGTWYYNVFFYHN